MKIERISDHIKYRQEQERQSLVNDIIHEIELETGLTLDEITAKSRKTKISDAKKILCYHLRVRTNLTQKEIGAILKFDRTSALYAIASCVDYAFIYKNSLIAKSVKRAKELAANQPQAREIKDKTMITPYAFQLTK